MFVLPASHTWEQRIVSGRHVFNPPDPPLDEQFRQIAENAGGRAVEPFPLRVRAGGVTFHTSR